MEQNQGFTPHSMFEGMMRANHKLVQNYLNNLSGYNHDMRDMFLTYFHFATKFAVNTQEIFKVQNYFLEYLVRQQGILDDVLKAPAKNGSYEPFIQPREDDKRFRAPEWNTLPFFNYLKQNYILTQDLIRKVIDDVDINEKSHDKLRFYAAQLTNLFSPSNFLFTNPEALRTAMETSGASLWNGFNNFLKDLDKEKITQTDESAFRVGKNLALSKGSVVYQNELIQLIQYAPATDKVYEVPLLIIPPWINKFYVLDMQPENSFVKYMTEKGFTVFMISWKNPGPELAHLRFDDYVEKGALAAISVAKSISGSEKINALGYCLGGTLLSVAASILGAKNDESLNTITWLAAMVDFKDIGPMGAVVDAALVNKLKRGELLKNGLLHGYDMERAFNLMRVNDLVWNYVISNYLKGQTPKPFDVLYWTNDNTNLPGDMYAYYIGEMILKNNLSRKNALTIAGHQIDIGKIKAPAYVVALKEDYISPPETVYTTTELVNGPVEFFLGESGHVMGVINPPERKKYGHYEGGNLGGSFGDWQKTAKFSKDSWWNTWSEKLIARSGKKKAAPAKEGNKDYQIVEAAPGTYVMETCEGTMN